jgi:hypothetical protein
MKTDFYTKTILTVIAICLMVIVYRGTSFISVAHAGPYDTQDVRITGVNSYAFQYAGPIHVICDSGCR